MHSRWKHRVLRLSAEEPLKSKATALIPTSSTNRVGVPRLRGSLYKPPMMPSPTDNVRSLSNPDAQVKIGKPREMPDAQSSSTMRRLLLVPEGRWTLAGGDNHRITPSHFPCVPEGRRNGMARCNRARTRSTSDAHHRPTVPSGTESSQIRTALSAIFHLPLHVPTMPPHYLNHPCHACGGRTKEGYSDGGHHHPPQHISRGTPPDKYSAPACDHDPNEKRHDGSQQDPQMGAL